MSRAEAIRLNSYLAKCGIASRRKSEEFILQGRVSLNGTRVHHMATLVSPQDCVQLDGKRVEPEATQRYLALHKPPGYLCSNADVRNRPLVSSLIHLPERVFHVGRLDFLSSGLIFYTNDGDFSQHILHPSHTIEKEYLVVTKEKIDLRLLAQYQQGTWIDGIRYQLKRYRQVDTHCVRLVLVEGKNREIRRVFTHHHMSLRKIHRIRIGTIGLGSLREGHYRHLSQAEIRSLMSGLASRVI